MAFRRRRRFGRRVFRGRRRRFGRRGGRRMRLRGMKIGYRM